MELIAPVRVVVRLSPRQRRLLELLCDGHEYKTAAAAMGVTVNTVGFHMRSMYARLGVHSKTEAVAKTLRRDLLGWHTRSVRSRVGPLRVITSEGMQPGSESNLANLLKATVFDNRARSDTGIDLNWDGQGDNRIEASACETSVPPGVWRR